MCLAASLSGMKKTIIAVPDFTREAHLGKILPPLIKQLGKKGIRLNDIEILIGTGLHRPPTKKEIRKNLGKICDKVMISSHDHRKNVIYFGKSKKGVPIYLNKKLKYAHSIITIGVVEPHLYAGYSGGIKVVSIGLAGEKTINYTHHPRFLDDDKTRICNVTHNAFRDLVDEILGLLPITISVNIVNDSSGKISKVFIDDPAVSFKKAVRFAKKSFEKRLNRSYDVIICNIPKEKSVNIYQASRAFNYVLDSKSPPLKKKPLILVKASLEEGFGLGLGEKRFKDALNRLKDPEMFIRRIKKQGCLAGEHRAYMVAKALKKADIGFISKRAHFYNNKGLPFLFFKDFNEVKYFLGRKNKKIYYLDNAFHAILVKK